MEGNRIGTGLVALGTLFLGLCIMVSVLLGQGNTVGTLSKYILVAGLVFSLLSPRNGFYLWLFFCAYSDFLKRIMVISGRVSMDDLTYVLGIAPMTFGGVVVTLILAGFIGRRPFAQADFKRLVLSFFLLGVSSLMVFIEEGKSMSGLLRGVANSSLYTMLVFVVPILFPTLESVAKLFRFILLLFLPVAIYGIIQQATGFRDFEIDYLQTGLSIEVKQLLTPHKVRAFSTLNSPTAYGAMCGLLFCFSLYFMWFRANADAGKSRLNWVVAILISGIYMAGMLASTARSSALIPIVGMIAVLCFRSRFMTKAFYASCIGGFVLLVITSPILLPHLSTITDIATGGQNDSFRGQLTNINSYTERLLGFRNVLMNPSAYTLFGHRGMSSEDLMVNFYMHDALSRALLRYGVVGVGGAFLALGFILTKIHGTVLRIKDPNRKLFIAGVIGIGLSCIGISILSGGLLSVFPVNAFFWLMWAVMAALNQEDHLIQKKAEWEALNGPPPEVVNQVTLGWQGPAGRRLAPHRFGSKA